MVYKIATSYPKGKYRRLTNQVPSSFATNVDRLSYKQLVRVLAVADATGPQEQREAKRITRALVPAERSVVNSVNKSSGIVQRNAMLGYVRKSISKKNQEETMGIDTDEILQNMLRR